MIDVYKSADKRKEFKLVIANWTEASKFMYKLAELANAVDAIDEPAMKVNNIMLAKVKEIMEIPQTDVTLYDDEWFWAEWTATDECFWYVLGKTQTVRQDAMLNKRCEIDNYSFTDKWLCVWSIGYSTQFSLITKEEAPKMFIEGLGYDKEDIDKIMNLEPHETWEEDPNGLRIFKG